MPPRSKPPDPFNGQVVYATQQGLETDLIQTLAQDQVEWSGRFGSGWVSATMGQETEVKYLASRGVPWHTHPDGDPRLSLEDWILFLLDPAETLLLATSSHLRLYRKLHLANIVFFSRRTGLTGQISWSLNVARFGKFLSQSQQIQDPYHFSEVKLCQDLEITVENGKKF